MSKIFLLLLPCLPCSLGYCPKDATVTAGGNYCYSVNAKAMLRDKAMQYCSNLELSGATIRNEAENRAVLTQARLQMGNDLDWLWLGGGYANGKVIWDDGTPSNYTNFEQRTPADGFLVIHILDGKWDTVPFGWFPVACGGEKSGPCVQKPPCQDGWTYSIITRFCYKLVGNFAGFTWPEARSKCQSLHADLVSIHSDEENRIVAELADTYLDIQVDFYNWTQACTWIGGTRNGTGKTDFIWVDGTDFDYTNWADGQPDYFQKQDAAQIYTTRHNEYRNIDSSYLNKWDDVWGFTKGYNAVCKKKARY